MASFLEVLNKPKLALVVSLPENRLDLAKAALDAGADAIKVHLNVWHRASGNTFGSWSDNREFFAQLLELAGEKPVGVVPGTAAEFISFSEMREMEEAGVGFFSTYADDLPPFMLKSSMGHMVALHDNYQPADLDAIRAWSQVDVVEAAVINGSEYGSPLRMTDLLRYRNIVLKTEKPVLVPTQRKVQPDEVYGLQEAGCSAVMIGAIVMDPALDACAVGRATADFRREIDAL